MESVFIVSSVRTAIGEFGGGLAEVSPAELGTLVTKEVIARASVPPQAVESVVFSQVIPTEPSDAYLPRVVSMNAGIPRETPAMAVNRLCGSGLQAIISAAQSIKLGDAHLALAGGVESMSRVPYSVPKARFGIRLGDTTMVDTLVGVLTDPFNQYHMGMTAENVASEYGISRTEQDDLAWESHRRASNAISSGRFKEQIVPVVRDVKGKRTVFDQDEHVRFDAKREDFSSLRPAFRRDGGTVTAGNSSGINDGAAAVILADEAAIKRLNLQPIARLVSYAHAGVDPSIMGIGPVPATILALSKANISVEDLSVIEANEAFAAQACAVSKELKFDTTKVNPNGSGISLGHPIGATGAILVTKAIAELSRIGGRYALVTMCIGGGQGIAAVFERV